MSFEQRFSNFLGRVADDIFDTLDSDVAEMVKDIMEQKLTANVYSYQASETAMNSRRYDDGGLLDRENMVGSVEYDPSQHAYVLTVSDEAPFQEEKDSSKGDDLSDVVQIPIQGYNQPGPRPFTQPTEDECISSGRALEAFNAGMRRRGHEIEIL